VFPLVYLPNAFTCKTSNVVYLLQCKQCSVQYVGETGRKLSTRIAEHIYNIKNPDKASCKILAHHFNGKPCKDFTVNILEKIDDRLPVKEARATRRLLERNWTILLRSKYPYGLNDKLQGEKGELPALLNMPKEKRLFRKRGKRIPRSRRKFIIDPQNIFHPFIDQFENNKKTTKSNLYKFLMCTAFKNIKLIYNNLNIMETFNEELKDFIKDILESRTLKVTLSKKRTNGKNNKDFMTIHYANKGQDLINLSRIIHTPSLISLWPVTTCHTPIPVVCYSYDIPLGRRIFNYKYTIKNADINQSLLINAQSTCPWQSSSFKDPHYGHVITSDINFIHNDQLRQLLQKGTNYRPSKKIDFGLVQKCVNEGAYKYINKICHTDPAKTALFIPWLNKLDCLVKLSIQNLNYYRNYGVLKDDVIPWKEIKRLQKDYVITTVDKANNNYAFICKNFYIYNICKELGIDGVPSNTYRSIFKDKNKIIKNLTKECKIHFNINVPIEQQVLPFVHIIPKFHKNPVKFRAIIASKKSAMKPASTILAKILQLIYDRMKSYCTTIERTARVRPFWVINNSAELCKVLHNMSAVSEGNSVYTYDFTTLYTKLEHQDIKQGIQILLDKAFNTEKEKYIHISPFGAYWTYSSVAPDNTLVFSKNRIHQLLMWVIDNTYFTFGNHVFKQNIGIPMGTNCAPLIANLLLHSYELQFFLKNMRKNVKICHLLRHTYRYLDDISVFNDKGTFDKYMGEIYPPSLLLDKINTNPNEANVLDLHLQIENAKFIVNLYDKRNEFPFECLQFPSAEGNIPASMGTCIISSQIIRYANICSTSKIFSSNLIKLIKLLHKKGYSIRKLTKTAIKILNKYDLLRNRYKLTISPKQFILNLKLD